MNPRAGYDHTSHGDDVDRQVQPTRMSSHVGSLGAMRLALQRLQLVRSTEEFTRYVAEAVCEFGFDRTLVSWVNDSYWVGDALVISADPDWALELIDAIKRDPPRLAQIPEVELVSRRMPLLVSDAQSSRHAKHVILSEGRSRSYVAAPITAGNRVVAMIHADCYFGRRSMEQVDRELLSIFAEGASYALQRTMLIDELDALKAQLADLAGHATSVAEICGRGSRTAMTRRGEPLTGPRRPTVAIDGSSQLTVREVEVMELVAAGASNTLIAAELFISYTTVKTHIKHILRKLNAENRAAAVSIWMREGVAR